MAISDKLTYLNETKSQLKDMINYGLDDDNKITSSTTFRNYVSSIFNAFLEALRTPDTLFNNLPKITGSGANITLNDTANAPMRIELGASELSQDGTPTPSSPQDIHTISGSNTIKVESKNQLTGTWEQGTFSYVDNANYTDANRIRTTKFAVQPSTEYTFSCNSPLGEIAWIFYQENGTTYIAGSSLNTTGTTATITTPNNAYYIRIRIGNGTYPKTYTTDYHQRLDDDSYISQEAEVDLGYENLFDKDNANILNSYINASGVVSASTTDRMIWLPIKANTNYTFQITQYSLASIQQEDDVQVGLFNTQPANNVSGTRIFRETRGSSVSNKSFTYTFNSGSNTYVGIKIGTLNKSDYNQTIGTLQLNEGTTALPYTEYGKKIEYCKIGNYEDKFIRTSGKNLFEISSDITGGSGYYTYNDGTIKITSSNTGAGAYWNNKINVQEGTYTFMLNLKSTDARPLIKPLDSNGNILTNLTISGWTYNTYYNGYYKDITTIGNNVSNISIASSVKQIQIGFVPKTVNGEFNNIYFGEQATDYEPYGTNEWYIKKNIGKVVLDGTEDGWNKNTEAISTNAYINNNLFPNRLSRGGTLCNYLNNVSSAIGTGIFSGGGLNFCFESSDFDTVEKFTTWLSTHNTIVYYQLATPTYTQITGTLERQLENVYQKLLSYTGTTNISQVNNDISFNLSVQAIEE